MKKVLREQAIARLDLPAEFSDDFSPLYQKMSSKNKGSIKETAQVERIRGLRRVSDFTSADFTVKNSVSKMVPPVQKRILSQESQGKLKTIYQQMYPTKTVKFFPVFYEECRRAIIGDEIVSSVRYKDDHQAVIVAFWPSTGSSLNSIDYTACNVGLIQYFVKHSVIFTTENNQESTEEHLFCYIKWKQHHPNRNWFGVSAVLSSTLDEIESPCCYMPIQRIMHRCASGIIAVDFGLMSERVFVTVPLGTKYCF